MKTKVLNIISDTNIGGAGKCIITYCNNYDKEKYDITVLIPKDSLLKQYLEKTDVKILEIEGIKDKSFDIGAISKLKKIIKEEKPDIVHTHSSLSARIAARLAGKYKIVYTKHCAFPVSKKYKYKIVRKITKIINEGLTDKIIASAQIVKDDLIKQGISDNIIEVVLNGIDKLEKIPQEKIKEIKEKYSISENEKVVGYLARIEKLKGHEYFVEAASEILKTNKNYKFIIAGIGSYEEEIKNKIKQLNIQDNVIFTGFIKNVNEILSIMDVQVNASYISETTNLSLLEGMSLGLPAVATDVGGSRFVIQDKINGVLVEKENYKQIADGIMWILENKERYNELSRNCEEIFDNNFTSKKYAENIEKVYEGMVKEK